MLKRILFFFSLLYSSLAGFGQNQVTGKIIDQITEEPIEFANISMGENGKTVLSDDHGNFKIKFTKDNILLHVSMIGYKSRSIEIRYRPSFPVIMLERGPVDLKEIIISPQTNNASFHTISSIDLNMRPVNSAQDLMRLVPGLFLGQHQGGGIAEHIFFRGFDADHGTDVNVSVDGMPLNLVSHVHGQGFSDLHFLIPELVTKYEFGKGPYYADHGDFTTAGYVNFNTVDVLNKNLVKLEAGQFNSGRFVTILNLLCDKARLRGESAYIAWEAAYTDGPFDLAQHLNRLNLFGKYNIILGARNKLRITLSTFSSGWRSSGEIPERTVLEGITDRFGYIDSTQGGYTSRTNAVVLLSSGLSEKLLMENQFYYSKYHFNLRYDDTFFASDSINGDQLRQKESRNLVGYNGILTHRYYFGNNASLISKAGAGWQFNRINNSELSHITHENTLLEYFQLGNINETALNGFIDENLQMGKWLLNFGSRIDYLNFNYEDKLNPPKPARSGLVASPKLNIEYTANSSFQLYLKTGKGFHSNDAKVVISNLGQEILPAAYGADLGLNWKPFAHIYFNMALWYLYLQQEFVYNADDGTTSPTGKTRRLGLDLSARYQFNKWLFATLDINLSKARYIQAAKGNDYLPLAVPLSSVGGLEFKLANGINGGISYRYMKDRPANQNNSLVAKGYFVCDLTANYTKKKYEIGFEIQNLLNTEWREAQFEVQSRLRLESHPIDEISFTSGTPFFAKLKFALFF